MVLLSRGRIAGTQPNLIVLALQLKAAGSPWQVNFLSHCKMNSVHITDALDPQSGSLKYCCTLCLDASSNLPQNPDIL